MRTPEEQAKFDAAELINQSQAVKPATEDVVLEVQNIKEETKSKDI